jgi:hypothetical protein
MNDFTGGCIQLRVGEDLRQNGWEGRELGKGRVVIQYKPLAEKWYLKKGLQDEKLKRFREYK